MESVLPGEVTESAQTTVGLPAAMARILGGYSEARREPFKGNRTARSWFETLERELGSVGALQRRPALQIDWSVGKGSWAAIPWIALLDSRETTTTQHGLYVALLWREDMSGVYLTVMQGVTQLGQLGAAAFKAELSSESAAVLSASRDDLVSAGFDVESPPDLRGTGTRAKAYELATIAHRLYPAGRLPSSEEIDSHLSIALGVVDRRIVERSTSAHTSAAMTAVGVAIYVGRAAEGNLKVGLDGGLWGWKKEQAGLAGLPVGSPVVLGMGFSGGSPRTDDLSWKAGRLHRVVFARTTGSSRFDPNPFWPDEGPDLSYPHRIGIEFVGEIHDAALEGGQLPAELAAALKRSVSGGNAIPFNADLGDLVGAARVAPTESLFQIGRSFAESVASSGMAVTPAAVERGEVFLASVIAKPFSILSGLSGSGKTQLAMRLGEWFGESAAGARYLSVAVRPDWTGPEALLGYEDALREPRQGRAAWFVPETLAFLLRATADSAYPYLLLLDEMNLAHVERYFSDVLSGMESRLPTLPNLGLDTDGEWRLVANQPSKLPLPKNLVIVGTVNVDETTYLFSPKVLDRATTFEVRTATDELQPGQARPTAGDEGSPSDLAGVVRFLLDDGWQLADPSAHQDVLVERLKRLHAQLSLTGDEFGHRLLYESLRFASALGKLGNDDVDRVLDYIVLLKILPRIHGSRRRVEPVLKTLQAFAQAPGDTTSFGEPATGGLPALPRSASKVARMLATVEANQFVSFTE